MAPRFGSTPPIRTHFNRASTYQATRQYARAAEDWREVIRLDPPDAEAHDGLGWLLATCADE
jgi:hypothetical protein